MIRSATVVSLLGLVVSAAACGREGDGRPTGVLARDSGVAGAGTGPSTRAALAAAAAAQPGSAQNNGPNAGGPH